MAHTKSVVALLLAMGVVAPASAQSSTDNQQLPQPREVIVPGRGSVLVQPVPTDDPHALPRTVIVPGRGEIFVVPVRPKDTRSARQRCIDNEAAKIGGSLSELDRSSINLKCSQW